MVDGVHITGAQGTVDFIGSNLTLQNSLIEGTNLGSAWYQTAVALRAGNDVIRFNTIVLDPGAPSSNACVTLVNKDIAAHIYGNILISNGRVLQLFDSAGTFDVNTIAETHHNLYLSNATFGYISMTPNYHFVDTSLVDWKAAGNDQNSVIGDPHFTDRAHGNFKLSPGSIAIDAIPLNVLSSVPSTDLDGNARPKGSGLDIGAYEKQ